MRKMSVVVLFVLVYAPMFLSQPENIEIETPLGKVIGTQILTRLRKVVHAFFGVKYAEPPVGLQRFQPPVPIKPWNILNATDVVPYCPRTILMDSSDIDSEDCLHVNVYTKNINQTAKSPVIVYFHGPIMITCEEQFAGPEYLLDHDLVLVIVSSRHSALGYMSTGDSLLPGNLGLKDQVEALRWVKNNIDAYGGDPNLVTIAGHSMGAWSVSLHMVSPMSKGLFHRAIAIGGSAAFLRPLPTNQTHVAKKQAEILGCPTDTVGNMLVCLNTKTPGNFSKSFLELWNIFKDPLYLWLPVVEPEVRGVERFLPDQPIELMKQGKVNKVPFIIGLTKYEFAIPFDGIKLQTSVEDMIHLSMPTKFNISWNILPGVNFISEHNTECSKKISDRLMEHYFPNKFIDKDNFNKLEEIVVDALTIYPVHRMANSIAEASDEPVYYYEFTFKSKLRQIECDMNPLPTNIVDLDDIMYIFELDGHPLIENVSPETKILERMTSIWYNFAKTGEPISKDDKKSIFENVNWEKFTPNNKNYLEIDTHLSVKTNLNVDRMKVWDELFLHKCT